MIREQVIQLLLAAGVDGLPVDDLDSKLEETVGTCYDSDSVINGLVIEGMVEHVGCSWVRLSRSEWERRLAEKLAESSIFGSNTIASISMALLWPMPKSKTN